MQCARRLVVASMRRYHRSATCFAGRKWRLAHGLGQYGNEYGPLTDIPEWSYADGRPAPIQFGEKNRQARRKDFAEKALKLMEEMKESRNIHKTRQQAQTEARERYLKQKLKPKNVQR